MHLKTCSTYSIFSQVLTKKVFMWLFYHLNINCKGTYIYIFSTCAEVPRISKAAKRYLDVLWLCKCYLNSHHVTELSREVVGWNVSPSTCGMKSLETLNGFIFIYTLIYCKEK